MKELISSSPHENGITTIYDRDNQTIIKSTSGKGCQHLLNEMLGFDWYVTNLKSGMIEKNDYVAKFGRNKKYLRLLIKEYSGEKCSPYEPIEKKLEHINGLINHYFTVWERTEFKVEYPIHGDFSVGNCVLKNGQILLFDWEHFRTDAALFGFDLVYLYYESVFFAMSKPRGLTENRVNLLKELKHSLSEKLNSKLDFNVDLNTLVKYLIENENHWGSSLKKLPVLHFSPKQVERLNSLGL